MNLKQKLAWMSFGLLGLTLDVKVLMVGAQ